MYLFVQRRKRSRNYSFNIHSFLPLKACGQSFQHVGKPTQERLTSASGSSRGIRMSEACYAVRSLNRREAQPFRNIVPPSPRPSVILYNPPLSSKPWPTYDDLVTLVMLSDLWYLVVEQRSVDSIDWAAMMGSVACWMMSGCGASLRTYKVYAVRPWALFCV